MRSLLEANLDAVNARIAAACRSAGRDPAEVQLLAVTKSVEPPVAAALAARGQLDLGENRPAPFEAKCAYFEAQHPELSPRWHWIGHLQRNKARRVLQRATILHAVDSERLLDTVARLCAENGWTRSVYLQVKLTDEATKHGLAPGSVPALSARAGELPGVELAGLMTLAPLAIDATAQARSDAARRTFAGLRELGEGLEPAHFTDARVRLSMGMSGDLEDAVREGSHVVRVGTALFEGLQDAGANGPAARGEAR